MENYRNFVFASKTLDEALLTTSAKTIISIEISRTNRFLSLPSSSSSNIDNPQTHAEAYINSMFQGEPRDRRQMIQTLTLVLSFKDSGFNNCTRACLHYLVAVAEFLRDSAVASLTCSKSLLKIWGITTMILAKSLGRGAVTILKTHSVLVSSLHDESKDTREKWKLKMSEINFSLMEDMIQKKSPHALLEVF